LRRTLSIPENREEARSMHLEAIEIHAEKFPAADRYPFNLGVLRATRRLDLTAPVTFLIGENGSGKSTLLEAVTRRCGIMIWQGERRARFEPNPYEDELYRFVTVRWSNGRVPGSFFGAHVFENFSRIVDEWATMDPGILAYYGGRSLMAQSHGQSILAYFRKRFETPGLYLLDEPETALSPRSQLELLRLLARESAAGHAQFIVATHSPLILACPGAVIYDFDRAPLAPVAYEETEHFRVTRDFMADPQSFRRLA
jgi:predicted ATPase